MFSFSLVDLRPLALLAAMSDAEGSKEQLATDQRLLILIALWLATCIVVPAVLAVSYSPVSPPLPPSRPVWFSFTPRIPAARVLRQFTVRHLEWRTRDRRGILPEDRAPLACRQLRFGSRARIQWVSQGCTLTLTPSRAPRVALTASQVSESSRLLPRALPAAARASTR